MTLILVTKWSVDSSGHAGAQVKVFTDYNLAVEYYGKRLNNICGCGATKHETETFGNETVTNVTCDCEQNFVSITQAAIGPGPELEDYQDGSWKRTSGKSLKYITDLDGTSIEKYIRVYPQERPYNG